MSYRVLIVKTSSLGDVIHTLPAITDAAKAIPGIQFDWVVEQAFAEVPGWHDSVSKIIPIKLRYWRKHPVLAWRSREWSTFKAMIKENHYDVVIDAQGLLKSAWLTRFSHGPVFGLDKNSAREPLSAWFYDSPVSVRKNQHAVERTRQLFAKALGYTLDVKIPGQYKLTFSTVRDNTVVLLHGTTWPSKHWAEESWVQLARKLKAEGYKVLLPWGNNNEKNRAESIAIASGAEVLPGMSLTELAKTLATAAACVSVDTGLGHLAAAVETPTVSLFGPTNSQLTGFYGQNQVSLQSGFHCSPCLQQTCRYVSNETDTSPCFAELSPESVAKELFTLLTATGTPP